MKFTITTSIILFIITTPISFATPFMHPLILNRPASLMPIIHLDSTKRENKESPVNIAKLISVTSNDGLIPQTLKAALGAYSWALSHEKLGRNKDVLTVVDFTLPSYEKRMWVINLRENKVLMKLHTTQGAGSGVVIAKRFSNVNHTQESSLGLYVTSEEYYGGHGKSMRLDGLQKGINDNARKRNIVIHAAAYASPEYIKANHRAGRSWGCFAVAPSRKDNLLAYIKGGSAFFAYAPSVVTAV